MGKYLMAICSIMLTLCFFLCGVSAVYAQESDIDEFTLEEITVTAEKREADLQKTPISMTVIKGETILNNGSTTIADVLKDIPNITTSDSGTGAGFSINIRGLGNDMPTGMGQSSVSVNYDGAYEDRGETTLFGTFDVDRVEVLRGPQGTLYGRNATGGVLNIVSARPRTDKVEGYASLEVAEYEKKKLEAAINVPMADTLAGRLSLVTVKQDGTTKDDHGYRDSTSGIATRLQFRYMPNDEASFNLLYNYTEKDGQSWVQVSKENWDAGLYDVNENIYPYHLTNRNNVKNIKLSLISDFPLGPGNVTFIPTYETSKGTSSSYGVDQFAGSDAEPEFSAGQSPYDYVSKIADLSYTNKEGSDFDWKIGLYYTETDDPRDPGATRGTGNEFSSKAVFARVNYPFSETLRVLVGGRYDDTERSYYDAINYLHDTDSASFSYFDYTFGVEKDISADIMGYFTVGSGHKAGGFSDDGTPFDMESNVSGELGIKSRFLDNRLQVNGNVFYNIYDGYQVVDGYFEITETGERIGHFSFFNADKARNLGAEIETNALVGDATELTLSLNYLKNEYTDDFFVHPMGDPVAVNLKGSTMPHSPEFQIMAGINHTFYLSDGSSLKPSLSYRWTDKQYLGFYIIPEFLGPAYSVVDFSLSFNTLYNWSMNFYANNALDEHYYSTIQNNGTMFFPSNPRIMGFTLTYRF